jgi:hypothetical protein
MRPNGTMNIRGSDERSTISSALAMAAVEGYLRYNRYKFLRDTQEVPSFSIDLLKSVKATLNTLSVGGYSAFCKDPLSRGIVCLVQQ